MCMHQKSKFIYCTAARKRMRVTGTSVVRISNNLTLLSRLSRSVFLVLREPDLKIREQFCFRPLSQFFQAIKGDAHQELRVSSSAQLVSLLQNLHSLGYCKFFIQLYNAIAVLGTCPRMQGYIKKNICSTLIVSLAGPRTTDYLRGTQQR
jgi:hypothetical protein